MYFIDDNGGNRESGCRVFSNEDWIRFLPGQCPLARKVLPYLDQLHEQLVSHRWTGVVEPNLVDGVGIDDHDYYMTTYALLVLMVAWSINTGDRRWLDNTGLMAVLKGFESVDLVPDLVSHERHGWMQQCMRALEKMCMVSFGCLEDRLDCALVQIRPDFRESVFVPAYGWTSSGSSENDGSVVRIARLIDGHDVQMLKDVFYMVVGATTNTDGGCAVGPQEKSSRTDEFLVGARCEGISWAAACPTMSSLKCYVGVCSHFTGLLPVMRSQR